MDLVNYNCVFIALINPVQWEMYEYFISVLQTKMVMRCCRLRIMTLWLQQTQSLGLYKEYTIFSLCVCVSVCACVCVCVSVCVCVCVCVCVSYQSHLFIYLNALALLFLYNCRNKYLHIKSL